MARLLAYTSPARGHLYPISGVLSELHLRGHEIHVRTLSSEVGTLTALGFHAEPIAPQIEQLPLDDWRWKTGEESLAGVFRTFAARTEHEVPDLQRAIAAVQPDALLVDITTAGAAAVAEAGTIPWAQWIPFLQHDERVPDATLVPFTFSPAGMEALNAPRRGLGLAPVDDIADVWRAPLYLYFTAEPFEDPRPHYPPAFRFLGPGLWEPPTTAPPWLDEIEGPLVVVTASSEYQRDDALVETTLQALRRDKIHVLASTVAHDPDRFAVPENARVARWLPHGPLIQKAACVVCHGGMGITQRALAAGVPVCVVPFGRDQFEVAGRVVTVDAGTRILPDRLTETELRTAINGAMTMRAGAQRVAAGFAQAGGPSAGADAIESLLTTNSPHH
jgi:MGT family glycosyltransferase